MAVTEDDVRRALDAAPAPDGAPSLAQSPALSPISISGGRVIFSIQTTPDRAAALEPVRKAAEAAVRAVPGVTDVLVALTADRPAGSAPPPRPASPMAARGGRDAPSGAAPAPRQASGGAGVPGVRHIIAVASGKGGVGKSTTAANLALAFRAQGLRVGLMDADVYGPSVPTLFGLHEKPEVEGKMMKPLEAHGLKIMSIGFLVEAGTAMIWRGPMVMSALTQMLTEVSWGELDVLVVDMPPGTGDAQLTMAQRVKLSGAVIVSTPQDLALADARRGVAMFERVDVPILGIVENMSYYCCPNCGHRAELFGHGGARAEAERMKTPFLGEIPLSLEIRTTSDAGAPIVAKDPGSEHSKAYGRIAAAVWNRLTSGAPGRAAPRIVIER
ncbi:ATP-binding protein involved in chromosome partitioning [Methylopila capsulata]|uniref:Iron-sulfur cluster carrier protein n=1 Tax=Methylopila capsulata TaxID=61654 RepID=A0A9W6IUH7_9HYPH|nr:Mrp/NBP35 family ATP-binding protein [Methylopila capsulata]MBM7850261.1 ATP-binding protein involved in chromosome partitioning [Methylopila capsulata]GLK55554.1 iron-sulfur cluster carrier protein [Methylopila capsulata]